jgi:hypothetical protein
MVLQASVWGVTSFEQVVDQCPVESHDCVPALQMPTPTVPAGPV